MDAEQHTEEYQQALDQFVLYWGEMASAWGINKTMAQIHALLFASQTPLDTDGIMEQLKISRGNANMNLRNLKQWDLIHKVHYKGDRKDYYTAEKDIWETAARIIKERQRLEVTPIKENLNECLQILGDKKDVPGEEKEFKERMESFLDFLDLFEDFTNALLPYVNQKNMKSLRKFVNLAKKRNLLRSKPEEILPYPDEGGEK